MEVKCPLAKSDRHWIPSSPYMAICSLFLACPSTDFHASTEVEFTLNIPSTSKRDAIFSQPSGLFKTCVTRVLATLSETAESSAMGR